MLGKLACCVGLHDWLELRPTSTQTGLKYHRYCVRCRGRQSGDYASMDGIIWEWKMGEQPKCKYCENAAVKRVVWLKDRRHQPARISLPWCGCDLMTALKKFWPNPYQITEGVDYEVTALEEVPDETAVTASAVRSKDPIKLDQYGMAVWRHKNNKNLFAERTYEWCDRIVVLDETEGRRVIDDTRFTTFNFSDWIPVTLEEFAKVKDNFKEIYG